MKETVSLYRQWDVTFKGPSEQRKETESDAKGKRHQEEREQATRSKARSVQSVR